MSRSLIELRRTIELDASPDRLWPLLSDTGRVDRAVGIPAFERSTPEPDLTFTVDSHYIGVPVSWREYPYEWVFEQWHRVERELASPVPVKRLMTQMTLAPLSGGRSRVDVLVTLEPRNVLGQTLAPLYIGRRMLRDLLRAYRGFAHLVNAAEQVILPPPQKPAVNERRLAQGAEQLRQQGIRPALIERLTNHLRMADDPDVIRMRPFALADAWREDRVETLRMFLYATARAGILDLEWDVLCPNCRGPSVRLRALDQLLEDAHCESCNVRYDVNFDESVELRFTVSPEVRTADDVAYCIGGPANTRHIVSQIWIPAGGTKEIRLRLPAGDYRLRTRQFATVGSLSAADQGASAATVRLAPDATTVEPSQLAAGEVTLLFENDADTNLLVILEQTAWTAQAVSAAFVTALDEFRELFSSQVLKAGLGLSIRNLTFLFSDLKGSTRLYDEVGDTRAYARVRDHFDVMREIIGRWRGALVKTIGDAVMAVFPSAEDALEAGIEIQREFTEGQIARGDPPLRVKLGLHRGPCIAVNANDLLDYFGSTVNLAARVQGESIGGDIVVTPMLLSDPGVQRVLAREMPAAEAFERQLRGFVQPFTLTRLWMQGVPAIAPAQRRQSSPASAP